MKRATLFPAPNLRIETPAPGVRILASDRIRPCTIGKAIAPLHSRITLNRRKYQKFTIRHSSLDDEMFRGRLRNVRDKLWERDMDDADIMLYLSLIGDVPPHAKLIAFELLGDSWREDVPAATVTLAQ